MFSDDDRDVSGLFVEVGEVTDSLENILVHVGSVHRIPARIRGRFDNYKIIVSLFYAGDKVTEHISTDVYSTASQSHQSTADCIYFDQWLVFIIIRACLVVEMTMAYKVENVNTWMDLI